MNFLRGFISGFCQGLAYSLLIVFCVFGVGVLILFMVSLFLG